VQKLQAHNAVVCLEGSTLIMSVAVSVAVSVAGNVAVSVAVSVAMSFWRAPLSL